MLPVVVPGAGPLQPECVSLADVVTLQQGDTGRSHVLRHHTLWCEKDDTRGPHLAKQVHIAPRGEMNHQETPLAGQEVAVPGGVGLAEWQDSQEGVGGARHMHHGLSRPKLLRLCRESLGKY
ncbi:hypothetical protein E2C01_000296 [Portunus trituberculatus]|uniref:Uncharacterized protein n=1 Tax=Portunus trituberculatus TaxID=210409 RepID=A0A5B7CG42_PORTR|nr:hypothetical protein [Portunus trituberculatus]